MAPPPVPPAIQARRKRARSLVAAIGVVLSTGLGYTLLALLIGRLRLSKPDSPLEPQEQSTEADGAELTQEVLSRIGLSGKSRNADSQINPYPSPDKLRVAICLVGAARDFELTGPSIMYRVLTAYPGSHLFVNSPLDEASFKLHALAWASANVTVAGMRVFPNSWVDETQYPEGVIMDPTSPQGTQGMYQYFRLVEGCVGMISGYERKHRFRFNWILRTRVDTYWAKPPPPLQELSPQKYTIPFGTDCYGINDRLGVGTWYTARPALLRLSLIPAIALRNYKDLNSEKSFEAQMAVTNTNVTRGNFWFCVLSRRVYAKDMMPVASISSQAPLNGAKCRPCQPWLTGRQAEKKLKSLTKGARMGPIHKGVKLCNARMPWEGHWEIIFDDMAGRTLASQRQRIMAAPYYNCVAHFQQLRTRTKVWDAPSPEDLCLRRALGPALSLGKRGTSFSTFTGILQLNTTSKVEVRVSAPLDSTPQQRSWDLALVKILGRGALHFRNAEEKQLKAKTPIMGHILKLTLPRRVLLGTLAGWLERGGVPEVCQLLVAFAPPANKGERTKRFSKETATKALDAMKFQLSSCVQEPYVKVERCTYFSRVHCPIQLGVAEAGSRTM